MRKNALFGILLILITIFSLKFYFSSEKKLNSEIAYTRKSLTTAKEIISLKNSFKPIIPPFCKRKNQGETIKLLCKNLEQNRLEYLNEVLKKSKLKEFDIEKNQSVNAYLELVK